MYVQVNARHYVTVFQTTQTALWIGALSSSKMSESSFRSVVHALQSYVNVYPEHAIARVLLSLSYARQGSWTAAWRHLEAARAHEVPVEIEQAIIAAMLRSAAEYVDRMKVLHS